MNSTGRYRLQYRFFDDGKNCYKTKRTSVHKLVKCLTAFASSFPKKPVDQDMRMVDANLFFSDDKNGKLLSEIVAELDASIDNVTGKDFCRFTKYVPLFDLQIIKKDACTARVRFAHMLDVLVMFRHAIPYQNQSAFCFDFENVDVVGQKVAFSKRRLYNSYALSVIGDGGLRDCSFKTVLTSLAGYLTNMDSLHGFLFRFYFGAYEGDEDGTSEESECECEEVHCICGRALYGENGCEPLPDVEESITYVSNILENTVLETVRVFSLYSDLDTIITDNYNIQDVVKHLCNSPPLGSSNQVLVRAYDVRSKLGEEGLTSYYTAEIARTTASACESTKRRMLQLVKNIKK